MNTALEGLGTLIRVLNTLSKILELLSKYVEHIAELEEDLGESFHNVVKNVFSSPQVIDTLSRLSIETLFELYLVAQELRDLFGKLQVLDTLSPNEKRNLASRLQSTANKLTQIHDKLAKYM